MNYQPVYEIVLPEGDYYFKITKSEESSSKAGKPMLKTQVNVWDDKGNKNSIYWGCLLEFSGFIRNLAKATGDLKKYEDGTLEAVDFINKTGKCLVEVKENGLYEKKNEIKSFYAQKETTANANADDFVDDSVPF